MRFSSFFFALVACAAGCGGVGLESAGQTGKVEFAYQSSQCLLGCPLEHPVVEGALITITASGDTLTDEDTARFEPSSLGNVTYSASCDPVTGNERRKCNGRAKIRTDASGSAKLSIYDRKGQFIDAITFEIKRADRVSSKVSINGVSADAAAGGAFVAHVHDKLQVHSVVTANDEPLVFTENGLEPHYSDQKIIRADDSVLLSATDTEYAVADSPGTAQLTMVARGSESVTTFQIIP